MDFSRKSGVYSELGKREEEACKYFTDFGSEYCPNSVSADHDHLQQTYAVWNGGQVLQNHNYVTVELAGWKEVVALVFEASLIMSCLGNIHMKLLVMPVTGGNRTIPIEMVTVAQTSFIDF